jgi:phage terminase large subunit GpA-like protein
MPTAAEIYNAAFNDGLRPDPLLTVSEWADQFRMLSQTASAEPGRWRTDRTPYLREIMDCLSPSSGVEKVVFMKGAQVGGTEAGNNWIGYVIDQAPGPMLVVLPTVEMGKRWSKGRFAPLIDDTPAIRAKVKDPRSRDAGNTVQSKEFPGGIVVITGANSAVGLRSMAVRYLFMDEIDGYPGDADGEGDPVSLAVQRTATFARRKILEVSTPTVSGLSRIEKEFESSDQRFFHVPCPVCGHMQVLKWAQLRWQDNDPATVRYHCEACDTPIPNHGKSRMLEGGEWRSTAVGDGKTRGYHLSSLYSPVGWFSWEEAVRSFLKAKDDEAQLKVWVNTVLGETWVDRGEAPDWQRLYERRESYSLGIIPVQGLLLTAGADIQKDRIEVEVVAWGKGKESWSVDYRILYGDPAQEAVWQKLQALLAEPFRHASGVDLSIRALAVDTGFATQDVYAWCRKQEVGRVLAVKGVERAIAPVGAPTAVDVNIGGKRLRRGIKVWPVGVSLLKSELYQWLKLQRGEDEQFPSGYCHFPQYEAEYFKQLTAEQLVTKTVKGYPKREWQKLRERNEALDCRIYARAAAITLGIERFTDRHWQNLEEQLVPNERRAIEPVTTHKPQRPRVTRSRWMS